MTLFASTIALSAFLLFLVQPIIAKQILPWFGGSAAVWTTCMVFFQLVLLAGYAYADLITRRLDQRQQTLLHSGLLLASLLMLSTTGPLVQAWFARRYQGGQVYRLYALSNIASMLALIAYPPLIEPLTSGKVQSWGWSAAYAVFAVLAALAAWASVRNQAHAGPIVGLEPPTRSAPRQAGRSRACG